MGSSADTIMAMGHLPAKRAEESLTDDQVDAFAARIANGEHPKVLARKLYPNDHVKRRRAYKRFRRIALKDARVAAYVAEDARLEMLVGLKPAVAGLVGRAARGRPDAGKIVLEASGFHNPRVRHDHTGEIKLTLNIPRPELASGEVVDADVVE